MRKRTRRTKLGMEKVEDRKALTNLFPVDFDPDIAGNDGTEQAYYSETLPGGGEDDTLPGGGDDDTVGGGG